MGRASESGSAAPDAFECRLVRISPSALPFQDIG